jgi:hypothetical protein
MVQHCCLRAKLPPPSCALGRRRDENAQEKYKPDAIWFVDDVFTISHKWLMAFHEEVVKQNAHIKFECITRAERLNPEILQLLKEVGCFRIWIGAESGSQKVIDLTRRVDVNHVKKMIQQTNALGIETEPSSWWVIPAKTSRIFCKPSTI